MNIGVMSDSHDNLVNVRKAVEIFRSRNVEILLHCGDICSPFVMAELGPLRQAGVRMHAVLGNNDGDPVYLTRRGEGFCEFHDFALKLEVDGRRIVMMHYPDLAEDLFRCERFDLVLYGHNHKARLEGGSRKLLNPGTCSGVLAEYASVAIVDTKGMDAEIVRLG
jgi:uncharacterized protein